ncbi:GATA zinc finger domain-containing protein 1-like isoform X2 [Neocloeon triangulifer]|uniref:GATA zinc finger domain-containing protein 1-like isoform X2 n=1 Tax=Neocloeon triangulifer TaxID=2078957 RepID=UPI00286F4ADA|nr:GATA zinc finger domain-containing protein 1-like isoform X2 [Neocloeon triangulifer]
MKVPKMESQEERHENILTDEEIDQDVLFTVERLISELKEDAESPPAEVIEEPPCLDHDSTKATEELVEIKQDEEKESEEVDKEVDDKLIEEKSEPAESFPTLPIEDESEPAESFLTLPIETTSPAEPIELIKEQPEKECKAPLLLETEIEKEPEPAITIPKSTPIEIKESKNVFCLKCKSEQSWLWKRISNGFLCTSCENREGRFDGEDQPPAKRAHRDSVVILEGDGVDSSEPKTDLSKNDLADADGAAGNDTGLATPQPTRKSSRSTRSTLSHSNPYAYPRPVVSKPKEKKSVVRNVPTYSSPAPVLKLTTRVRHKGSYIKMGDIVSVRGHDGGIYYAQIRGLLEDQYCEKSAALTWLLPSKDSPPPERGFDPDTYIIGMEEDVPRSLESMEFVMHAPSDYFKLQLPYGFEDTYGCYNDYRLTD